MVIIIIVGPGEERCVTSTQAAACKEDYIGPCSGPNTSENKLIIERLIFYNVHWQENNWVIKKTSLN